MLYLVIKLLFPKGGAVTTFFFAESHIDTGYLSLQGNAEIVRSTKLLLHASYGAVPIYFGKLNPFFQ
jgi:hypothetical protein